MKQDKIFDANDRAAEMGVKDHRELIHFFTAMWRAEIGREQLFAPSGSPALANKVIQSMRIKDWNDRVREDASPVQAYINSGRWLAKCYCGNIEYVTPDDPIFFCHRCFNAEIDQDARPVTFPQHIREIEQELLKREIELPRGFEGAIDTTEKARAANPVRERLPLEWVIGVTVDRLKKENKENS